MPRYVCATCAAQFPDASAPPDALPDLHRRAPVRPRGRAAAGRRSTSSPRRTATSCARTTSCSASAPSRGWRSASARCSSPTASASSCGTATTCFDDDVADEIERRGGLSAIALSHPHYYSGMADWAARFDCPVLVHADDERWITRPDALIELWEGETRDLGDGLTLIHCGGHFAGGTVLHWRRRRGRRRRAAQRRHRAGHPRPHPRRLHVQLPQPHPAARGDRRRASPRHSSPTTSRSSTGRGGTGSCVATRRRSCGARRSAIRAPCGAS